MKKFIKGMVATFTFMLTLVVCGATKVGAEDLKPSINNTSITEETTTFTSGEKSYYVTADGKVTFKAAKNNNGGVAGLFYNTSVVYWARFSIAHCLELNGTACGKWGVYTYEHEGKNGPSYVMDDLLKGLVIEDISKLDYSTSTDLEVNGAQLGTLKSIYSLEDTYFAVVQYYQGNTKLFANKETYEPEIFPIVLESSLTEISVSHTVLNGVTTFTVQSGAPINTIKYFASSSKLSGTYDFASKFTENAGVVQLSQALENPKATNGVFKYEFTLTLEDGKFYYVQASDVMSNVATYDVSEGTSVNQQQRENNDDNIGDTNIGKIILIALLALLVISIALVIIQKIVDHKRKLY